jgi:TrmH family RNA methyltransferase
MSREENRAHLRFRYIHQMTHSKPPAVILVRPQEEGNVGAVARAMANMGLDELILVDPLCELGRMAKAFAVDAREILDGRQTHEDFATAVAPFHRLVATSSSRGRVPSRAPIAPRDLPGLLAAEPPGSRVALVFGGERSGLTTDELARCDPLVTIPAAARQPTLNLSQAVLILAYELWLARLADDAAPSPEEEIPPAEIQVAPPPKAASTGEVEGLFGHLEPLLRQIGFARDDTFDSVLRDLRRAAARASLTRHEVIILRGICRRGHNALR